MALTWTTQSMIIIGRMPSNNPLTILIDMKLNKRFATCPRLTCVDPTFQQQNWRIHMPPRLDLHLCRIFEYRTLNPTLYA